MKRLFGLALGGLLVLTVFSAPTFADGDIVKVMTRNQYLGADLTPIILAQTPAELFVAAATALTQAAANNFPLRAQRLATEVALTEPRPPDEEVRAGIRSVLPQVIPGILSGSIIVFATPSPP